MTRRNWQAAAGTMFGLGLGLAAWGQSSGASTDLAARLSAAVEGARASGVAAESIALGTSLFGRPISMLRLSKAGMPEGTRPAVLVVGGIDPRHALGVDIALGLIEKIAKDNAAALDKADIYILPRLNPDGFEGDPTSVRPRMETARKPAKPGEIDADRDGRFNEDPPVDLDGDGMILQMRVKDPAQGSGLTAEYIAEPDEPRLFRKADRTKGEKPVYAVIAESRDADGDGLYGEDGFEGVDLNRNFPYHWPEFRDDAGRSALSEPETRALGEWLIAHPNVVALVVYEPRDNLVNTPLGAGGKMDSTGEIVQTNHVLDDDRRGFEEVGTKFKELTKIKETPGGENDGSLQGWAYGHLGLWAFSTPVWVRPDQLKSDAPTKKDDGKKDESKKDELKKDESNKDEAKLEADKKADEVKPIQPSKGEKPAESGAAAVPFSPAPSTPSATPEPAKRKRVDSDEGKWIALSDERAAAGGTPGFVDWKPFKHPQLGDVEIGGFVPGFKFGSGASDVPRVVSEQAAFIADLAGRLPHLIAQPPAVERLGEGIWKVSVRAVNDGYLPTRSAMGMKAKRLPPTRWEITVDRPRLLAGEPVQRAESVAGSGGALSGEWMLLGHEAETVIVKLMSPECGDQEIKVDLKADTEAKDVKKEGGK